MEQPNQVTKLKSEGRVASGKRLAEWNRKIKEDLLKKTQEPKAGAQEPEAGNIQDTQVVDQVTSAAGSYEEVSVIGVGALAVLAIGLMVFFYTKNSKKTDPQSKKKEQIVDPFRM
jgi:hypothetical protein